MKYVSILLISTMLMSAGFIETNEPSYYDTEICLTPNADDCLTRYQLLMLLATYKNYTWKQDSIIAAQQERIKQVETMYFVWAAWGVFLDEQAERIDSTYWKGTTFKNAKDYLEKNNIPLP